MDTVGSEADTRVIDTGVAGLCVTARHFRIAADPAELSRRYLASSSIATPGDIVRIARKLGLKSRLTETNWDRLDRTPLPAIVETRNAGFLVVSRFLNGKIVFHRPGEPRGRVAGRDEFEKQWTGRMILVARRASLSTLPDV